LCRHGNAVSSAEGAYLEQVRREVRLGRSFSSADFERAFASFQQLYHVVPLRILCSPDVLARFSAIFEATPDESHRRALRFRGVGLEAAILAPGIIALEGEVDEDRMGDW